jgi:hypothetical protein
VVPDGRIREEGSGKKEEGRGKRLEGRGGKEEEAQ